MARWLFTDGRKSLYGFYLPLYASGFIFDMVWGVDERTERKATAPAPRKLLPMNIVHTFPCIIILQILEGQFKMRKMHMYWVQEYRSVSFKIKHSTHSEECMSPKNKVLYVYLFLDI